MDVMFFSSFCESGVMTVSLSPTQLHATSKMRSTANEQLEAFVHETERLALHFVQVFLDRVRDLREHGEQRLRHARRQLANVFNARLSRQPAVRPAATERSFIVNTVAICSFVSVDAISTRESALRIAHAKCSAIVCRESPRADRRGGTGRCSPSRCSPPSRCSGRFPG